jgi:hypothetical protein
VCCDGKARESHGRITGYNSTAQFLLENSYVTYFDTPGGRGEFRGKPEKGT